MRRLVIIAFVISNTLYGQDWSAEILRMKQEDQSQRSAYGMMLKSGADLDSINQVLQSMDERHYELLKDFAAAEGFFPDEDKYADEVLHSFWLLTMHQDAHPDFQTEVLSAMKSLKTKKSFLKRDLAFLSDRVAVNEGRCQTYGTQFDRVEGSYIPFELCDAKKVGKLRKKMKLMPLESQTEMENR